MVVIPKWLNETFLEKVLKQNGHGNDIKVHDFRANEAKKGSDGYASTIFKVKVSYSSSKTKSSSYNLIVKVTSDKKNVLGDNETFSTEISMYNLVREMERNFETAGEKIVFGPRLCYYSMTPEPVLVLEDLTDSGFGLNEERLDLDATKQVVTKIAKWHAASIFLEHDAKPVDSYKTGLFNLNNNGLNFIEDNFKLFVDEIKTWPGYERYIQKLDNLQYKFMKRGKSIYMKNSTDGFNVLNHGDFHFKNMLFKKTNGKISDVQFLDYQLAVWSTPAIDLYYLLYMIASDETRRSHEPEIIQLYHKEFSASLKKIGLMSKIPTMQQLRIELLKNKFLEVVVAICFLPYVYVDQSKAGNNIFDEANLADRKSVFRNPKYVENIKQILPNLLTSGVLD